MPYIKPEQRKLYDRKIEALAKSAKNYAVGNAESPAGQLNYIITKIILEVYGEWLPNYSDFNEIIGMLECVKLEMYRRHTAPYEDAKIEENGDVCSPLTKK